jgi:hypothetical protein
MLSAVYPTWTPSIRLFAVVVTYVIAVNISRSLGVTRRSQKSFRTALDKRLMQAENDEILTQASESIPTPTWNPTTHVSQHKVLLGWRTLHTFDAARNSSDAPTTRSLLAAEFDRRDKSSTKVNADAEAFLLTQGAVANDLLGARAALQAIRKSNDAKRDAIAAQQSDHARKGLFLLLMGGCAVLLAGHLLQHTLLLGVGAIGGVLSRLSARSNEAKRSANDYGMSWTKLILAPVSGALGALLGVFLIGGIGNAGFFGPSICPLITPVVIDLATSPAETPSMILKARTRSISAIAASPSTTEAPASPVAPPSTLPAPVATTPAVVATAQPCPVAATNPTTPTTPPVKQDRESTTTVALAIVLGFSERLFARMIGRSENYITGQLEGNNDNGGSR